MSQPLLLQAFEGCNEKVPAWIMRQAGRYLPQYQTIRAKYSLEDMFATPELAAKITCLPIDILNVDAAILFADILTLPKQMGAKIFFDARRGPVIESEYAQLGSFKGADHIARTIQLVKKSLNPQIVLIGFAGSPFTVLTYLIEKGSSANYIKTIQFAQQNPKAFHALMKKLTEATVEYLNIQKQAGIDAFQLFDSWAGILRAQEYTQWVLPYVCQIFEQVDLPSIYFLKNCSHLIEAMDRSGADFLSVCHTVTLGSPELLAKTQKGIQGNLYNGLLYADRQTIKEELAKVLNGARAHGRYIFNLSHGVFPDTDVETLKFIVKQVHEYKWQPQKKSALL